MAIVKQVMSDLPDNEKKMTPHSNFQLRFSETSLDVIRGFLFQYGVIGEVWLPRLIV